MSHGETNGNRVAWMPKLTRVAWLTDIHLNFVDQPKIDLLLEEIRGTKADYVLLGGDIAESHDVTQHLRHIDDVLQRPVCFVLGNHDFYFGSILDVRSRMAHLCAQRPHLTYLSQHGVVPLTRQVGLVGHEGWGDARSGDFNRSTVILNDYRLIDELSGIGKADLRRQLEQLGTEAAEHIRRVLPGALEQFAEVYLLTHVPPFREACWYEGRVSGDDWAPHFTCQAMGDMILDVVRQHPTRQVTVLCGHTHSGGQTQLLENLRVVTGSAEYGHPRIVSLFELPA